MDAVAPCTARRRREHMGWLMVDKLQTGPTTKLRINTNPHFKEFWREVLFYRVEVACIPENELSFARISFIKHRSDESCLRLSCI